MFSLSLKTRTQPHLPKYLPSTFKYMFVPSFKIFGDGGLSRNLSKYRLKVLSETLTLLNLVRNSKVVLVEIHLLNRQKYLFAFIFLLGVKVLLQAIHLKRKVPDFDFPCLANFLRQK